MDLSRPKFANHKNIDLHRIIDRLMPGNSKSEIVALAGPGTGQRLNELGIKLPAPPQTRGACLEASGMLPTEGHSAKFIRRAGAEIDVEAGRKAGRLAALKFLAIARQYLGSLDKVTRIVRLGVPAAVSGDVRGQPNVADAVRNCCKAFSANARVGTGPERLSSGSPWQKSPAARLSAPRSCKSLTGRCGADPRQSPTCPSRDERLLPRAVSPETAAIRPRQAPLCRSGFSKALPLSVWLSQAFRSEPEVIVLSWRAGTRASQTPAHTRTRGRSMVEGERAKEASWQRPK